MGETSDDPVPVVTRHGRHASEDLWYDMVRREGGTLDTVLPEIDRFLGSSPERVERVARFGSALAAKDAVRVIMPTWAGDDSAAILRMEHYRSLGVQYRVLDSPASWFWVDGDHLAVPFEWGEGRPTSVIGIRSAALAGMVALGDQGVP